MMKWIAGLLLLANLALFGWMRWGSALTVDADAVTAQSALNPDKIQLLAWPSASEAALAPTLSASGMSLTLSPIPAAASAPAPASAPAATPASVPVAAAPVVVPHVVSKTEKCAEWGEFSGDDLQRAQQVLATLKLGDSLSQRSVEQNHGYWVYIPPMKKRSAVERKIAQLKERGVKDYFVVQEKGKWQNAISLGVFKTKEAAEKYLESLRSKDVRTAKLGERTSKLRFTIFMIKGLDSGTKDKLTALQKDFPDGELKVSACSN
jgi:hypothetical protein